MSTLLTSRRASIMPVISDSMEPALRRGDLAVIEPVQKFEGNGIYACLATVGEGIEIWRVTASIGHSRGGAQPWLRLTLDNHRYESTWDLPLSQFEGIILGLVCGRLELMQAMEVHHG